jgi:hypothetical protein
VSVRLIIFIAAALDKALASARACVALLMFAGRTASLKGGGK